MALQARAELAQGAQLLAREITGLRERRVQRRRGMALRQHEAVARIRRGVFGVVLHHAAEVQRGEDIRA